MTDNEKGTVRRAWDGMRFLAINLWCARKLPTGTATILRSKNGQLTLRTVTRHDIDQFAKLHNMLRPDKALSAWRRWLYAHMGSKLAWVAEAEDGELAGFTMYYFREGEWYRGIVHDAFTGVVDSFRGCGLGGAMKSAAAALFSAGGLAGISTQIEHANIPSQRMVRSTGYRETGLSPSGKLLYLMPLPIGSGSQSGR